MIGLEYAPGRAWCAASQHAVAVFGPETPRDAVLAARARLEGGGDPQALASAVADPGAFALVVRHGGGMLLRRFRAVPARLDGEPLPTAGGEEPAFEPVAGAALELGLLASLEQPALPLVAGIARASAIRVALRSAHETPGLVARAADVDPAPPTDELPVFRVDARQHSAEHPAVLLASGERIPLDRGVLVGRRPSSERVDGDRPPRLVAVGSSSTLISRTHLRIEAGDDGVLATDLDSTNGTSVTRPGTLTQRLQPGLPARLHDGDVLNLGDGVVLTISIPSAGSGELA